MSGIKSLVTSDIDINHLIADYQNFFVPAFCIKVATSPNSTPDQDILKLNPPVAIFSVSVDRVLDEAGSFSFTIDNPSYIDKNGQKFPRLQSDSLFQPQRDIIIEMGYGSALKPVISGFIESVDVSFAANGISQLTIKGYDYLRKLMKEKKFISDGSRENKTTYSKVVRKILDEYHMADGADIEETIEEYSCVKNDKSNDFEFIKTVLAKEVGYEIYIRDKVFHFHRPRMQEASVITGMVWGKSLISFSPSLDTSAQVTKVEVKGWDSLTQEPIIGIAEAGSESNRGRGQSGSEAAEAAGNNAVEKIWREELNTVGQVQQYAQAVLDKRSQQLYTGSGECLGLPEIEPGIRIELLGLGDRFSKEYYITKVSHSISSSGFKTQFSVKENTLPAKGSI